jgi:flagellar biosynthesis GTPase FlhF
MKRIITQAEYDALSADMQAVYVKDGEVWKIKLEGDDPMFAAVKAEKAAAQKRAEDLEAELAAARAKETEAETKAREEREKAAKASGDVAAIEASWKEKVDAAEKRAAAAEDRATKQLEASMLDTAAAGISTRISTVPSLLTPQIRARLSVEQPENGKPIIRVLDSTGQPSSLSLAELEKEFVDNKDFAAIIKASDASGGGAGGEHGDGGGASKKKLSEMTATEEAKFANEHPEEYARMLKA